MSLFESLLVGFVLVTTVAIGIVVHELLHALCLRAAGVAHVLRLGGEGRSGRLGAALGAVASVRMERVPAGLAPWQLRVASLAPFALATPFLAIPLGLLPDPFATGNVLAQAALIGWVACALPSPQDFSLAWHAADVVDRGAQSPPAADPVAGD